MQKVLIMMMTPALRRFAFTTHVTSSVGWVGAVMVFLALATIGLLSPDEVTVRGVYLVMLPTAWFVLIPLAHASLLSGIVPLCDASLQFPPLVLAQSPGVISSSTQHLDSPKVSAWNVTNMLRRPVETAE